jgi:hypothetical protein
MMDMPVFVKIDRYKQSLSTLTKSKEKLVQARGLLDRLEQIRTKQDDEMNQLSHELAVIESKIAELQELFRHAE